MKWIHSLWFFPFSLVTVSAAAQSRFISGTVADAGTLQALAFCNVTLLQSQTGTHTNGKGYFRIAAPQGGGATLIFSYVGYETDTLEVSLQQEQFILYLTPVHGTLDEVVVTGVSRITMIRENPVSIVAVSARDLEKTLASNMIDVLVSQVPGLNAVKTGPNISKPFIRGLGYNRVLTLYDGIRQEGQQWGDEHGIEVDAYHVERAEVIKGPSSLMYGSDAVAGVVSLFPAVQREKDRIVRGKFVSEYQSNNGLIGDGLRLGYGWNRWLINVNGSYRRARNYTNRVDGRVYNTGFQENNASVLVGYSNRIGNSNLNLTLYDNLQGIPDGSRDSLTRSFTRQVNEFPTDQIKDRPIVRDQELNAYPLSPLHQHIQHYRIYSHHHYPIGKGDIDGIVGFQQNIRREYNHPQSPLQPGLYVRLNTLSYGVRYNVPEFSAIQIAVGLNGMVQVNNNLRGTDFPIPDYHLLDVGSYGFVKWKHNQWIVSGGGRYDFRQLSGDDFYVRENPNTGWKEHVVDTAGSTLQYPAFRKKYGGASWSVGGTFQLTERIGLKANVAQGYRAPNITEIASAGLDPGAHIMYLGNRNFTPEFNLQEDIGVSGTFKDAAVSFSIFNNTVLHYIYLAQQVDAQGHPIVLDGGNRVFQYQQASAQLYGMEATLDIHPGSMRGFNFNNNFSLVYGFNLKQEYENKGVNGEFLPFIPPMKVLSRISQDIKTGGKTISVITLKTEMDFNATQNRFLALYHTESRTTGYALWNLALGFDIHRNKKSTMQFQVQINNLFDRSYQSNLSRLKYFEYYLQSPNDHLGIFGMGRNVCVKLMFPF